MPFYMVFLKKRCLCANHLDLRILGIPTICVGLISSSMVLNKHLGHGIIALARFLSTHGFVASTADTSLFILRRPEVIIYLLVYVDDIIVISSSPGVVDRLVAGLRQQFSIKDLGTLHYFLGIEVSPYQQGL